MFSLCITTMDRYEAFLKHFLHQYIGMHLVSEIVICDETGSDRECILRDFPNNSKIRVYKNKTRLGPFLNKLHCCLKATRDWIVLMDSDNFADVHYFENMRAYIDTHNPGKCSVLAPARAGKFIYTDMPSTLTAHNLLDTYERDPNTFQIFFNTGNYVIHRHLVHNIYIPPRCDMIPHSSACDVYLFNTMLFEQFPQLTIHIVKNVHYIHNVHEKSTYLTTRNDRPWVFQRVHKRLLCAIDKIIKSPPT
jgi:hypothetical protein